MNAHAFLKALTCWSLAIGLSACGIPSSHSTVKSVEIAQTAVKSQQKIGFCWAYATVGFLESLMLKKTGVAVDLSEEAIGFYRMAEELLAMSEKYTAAELATAQMVSDKSFEGLEGWDTMFQPQYNPGLPVHDGFHLVRTYGVVPESVWSYKFRTQQQWDDFFQFVFTGFAQLMQEHGQKKVTREMVLNLLATPGAYGSRPPEQFSYLYPNGTARVISAVEFASDIIGFTPDDYTYMMPDAQIGYSQLVTAIKLTLARGIDVPFSYVIFKDQFDEWDGSYVVKDPATALVEDGGHVVLVTDFVNTNGRPGAISSAALTQEMAKSPEDLNYLVIKNSWGTTVQSPLLKLPGYHTIYQSYLKALVKVPTDVTIIVPRDIAFDVRYGNAGR